MSTTEERILGAITMAAITSGCDVDISAVGQQALFRSRVGEREAALWLQLGAGTEFIGDVSGSPDLYIGLLETAQNVCEEIWRNE